MMKRLALVGAIAVAAWLALLVVLGFTLGSRQERATKERLADSLEAAVTLGDLDLALVRGRLAIGDLQLLRDDAVGRLAIDVAGVRCELAPLGFALFDGDCRELYVRGVKLEATTASLFQLKRPAKEAPIRTDRLIIDDAVLVFLPSAFVPNLGRIEIAIEHARAGATTLRTPLSWLFSLRELRARFDLPAGISVRLGFADGVLTARGSLFGSAPVELPIEIPLATAAKDARDEIELLVELARDTAERLVAKRAADWLKSKLAP